MEPAGGSSGEGLPLLRAVLSASALLLAAVVTIEIVAGPGTLSSLLGRDDPVNASAPDATGALDVAVPPRAARDQRLNFLVIVSDDQRYDSMSYMPKTKRLLFDGGIVFPNAFATTPVCCPSRASILTGQYSHNHGVDGNLDPLDKPTVAAALHEDGYYTGLVGKYLNSWNGRPRAEYDEWVSFPGGQSPYTDPRLYVGKQYINHTGYMTYILRDYAVEFLESAAERDQPFFLLFAPNAPHRPSTPAPDHKKLYTGLAPHRPESYDEANVSDKPRWLRDEALTEQERKDVDAWRLDMLRSLASLDDAVASLYAALERTGELNDTVILYISDNGFFWGEHRLVGKGYVYEEASRVPFAVRFPSGYVAGVTWHAVVGNIDIAPTLYELSGLPIPGDVDGRSLVDLARPLVTWRQGILIEARVEGHPYKAVHTGDLVYVETEGDEAELYDLRADPLQLESRIDDPAYGADLADLRALFAALLEASGAPRHGWAPPTAPPG